MSNFFWQNPSGSLTKAPPGPRSGFNREETVDDFRRRIEWERWAAAEQRRLGHEAHAQGHDLQRVRYEDRLWKREQ